MATNFKIQKMQVRKMPTPMTQAEINAAMKALADSLAKDPAFLGKILYGDSFAREPETTLYCIGGVADGKWHSVPYGRHEWMIPERSTLSVVTPDFSRDLEPQIIETRATRYSRRRWLYHPNLPTFEFLAPGDWTDDHITDHLTGGKYGCDRRPRPQAPSHPAKASNPGERAGRTGAITIYNTATDTFRTIEDAGTRAGEITAWRCWELNGPRLESTFIPMVWPPDAPVKGDVTNGDVTHEGVHAFKHPVSALAYMLDFCANPGRNAAAYAFGSVDLYGEVIEHEIGYRAQYARVASLESAHAVRSLYLRERRREELDHMLNAARELYGVAQPGPRA